MTVKFTQVVAGAETIWALATDGTVWRYLGDLGWRRIENPQIEPSVVEPLLPRIEICVGDTRYPATVLYQQRYMAQDEVVRGRAATLPDLHKLVDRAVREGHQLEIIGVDPRCRR